MAGRGPAVAPSLVRDVLSTPGSTLDPGLRTDMERRLGHQFGAVRVHADSRAAASADAVASLAYTVGNHIVLGRTVATGDDLGRRVIAHELVHTIQQGQDASSINRLPVSSPSDADEQEAEHLGPGRNKPTGRHRSSWAPDRYSASIYPFCAVCAARLRCC
jgi:hypothetical protein